MTKQIEIQSVLTLDQQRVRDLRMAAHSFGVSVHSVRTMPKGGK